MISMSEIDRCVEQGKSIKIITHSYMCVQSYIKHCKTDLFIFHSFGLPRCRIWCTKGLSRLPTTEGMPCRQSPCSWRIPPQLLTLLCSCLRHLVWGEVPLIMHLKNATLWLEVWLSYHLSFNIKVPNMYTFGYSVYEVITISKYS